MTSKQVCGVTAAAGLRAYANAKPTFLYKERNDENGGKIGEAWLMGRFDAAAQLFLMLKGELFLGLDAPWWSPVSDRDNSWPFADFEYPLGSMGIGGDVKWLVGDPNPPELSYDEVDFEPSMFTSDIMEKPPEKNSTGQGGEKDDEGKWEDKSNANPNGPDGSSKSDNGLGRRKEDPSTMSEKKRFFRALSRVGELADNSKTAPLPLSVLKAKLKKIKDFYRIEKMEIQSLKEKSLKVFIKQGERDNKNNKLEIKLLSEAERAALFEKEKQELLEKQKELLSDLGLLSKTNAEDLADFMEDKSRAAEWIKVEADGANWVYVAKIGERKEARVEGELIEKNEDEHFANEEELNYSSDPNQFTMFGGVTHQFSIEVRDGAEIIILLGPKDELLKKVKEAKQTLIGLKQLSKTETPIRDQLVKEFEKIEKEVETSVEKIKQKQKEAVDEGLPDSDVNENEVYEKPKETRVDMVEEELATKFKTDFDALLGEVGAILNLIGRKGEAESIDEIADIKEWKTALFSSSFGKDFQVDSSEFVP